MRPLVPLVRQARLQLPPRQTVHAVLPHTAYRRRSPPAFGFSRQGLFALVLTGTQNEYERVTFGEDEQLVVGVHADAMVFTVTPCRRMLVVIVTGGAGHVIPRARPLDRAAKGVSPAGREACRRVEPDEGPHGLGNAQPSTRPPGRGGQNGQGVAQQVAGARKLVERLGVEPDQLLAPRCQSRVR